MATKKWQLRVAENEYSAVAARHDDTVVVLQYMGGTSVEEVPYYY